MIGPKFKNHITRNLPQQGNIPPIASATMNRKIKNELSERQQSKPESSVINSSGLYGNSNTLITL